MKAATIKIKKYASSAGNISIVNNNNIEKRILNMMLLALGVLALCYVLFLGNTIFNIIERKSLETDARTLSNEVGDLELQYLSLSNKVDLALAGSMGFMETTKHYATRATTLGSLKIANNDL